MQNRFFDFENIPEELLQEIFSYLTPSELYAIRLVNKKFQDSALAIIYTIIIRTYSGDSKEINLSKVDKKGRTFLHWAILCDQSLETIDRLIQAGSDVNAACKNGETPLHLAVGCGRIDIVNVLLAKNANVNARYGTAHSVIKKVRIDYHSQIMKIDLSKGRTPLHIAAQNGDIEIVKTLLENGAEVNSTCVYKEGCRRVCNYTPLYAAAKNGDIEVVKTLLANGAIEIASIEIYIFSIAHMNQR